MWARVCLVGKKSLSISERKVFFRRPTAFLPSFKKNQDRSQVSSSSPPPPPPPFPLHSLTADLIISPTFTPARSDPDGRRLKRVPTGKRANLGTASLASSAVKGEVGWRYRWLCRCLYLILLHKKLELCEGLGRMVPPCVAFRACLFYFFTAESLIFIGAMLPTFFHIYPSMACLNRGGQIAPQLTGGIFHNSTGSFFFFFQSCLPFSVQWISNIGKVIGLGQQTKKIPSSNITSEVHYIEEIYCTFPFSLKYLKLSPTSRNEIKQALEGEERERERQKTSLLISKTFFSPGSSATQTPP